MDTIKPSPEIYREAARIIEEEGWIKGDYYKPNQGYCTLGAVRKACKLDPHALSSVLPIAIVAPLTNYVRRVTGRVETTIHGFNDSQESAEPVVKMLNDIADTLDTEERE